MRRRKFFRNPRAKMKSASTGRRVALAVAVGFALSRPAAAQTRRFPWRAGDRPPRVAGFWRGERLDSARKTIKGAVTVDTLGRVPSVAYSYSTADHSLSVLGTSVGGVAIITVRRRDLAAVGGVRVGDRCADVVRRWGKPHRSDAVVAMWIAGKWLVSAHCDVQGIVSELSVGNVA
jgi:hypothetical protein